MTVIKDSVKSDTTVPFQVYRNSLYVKDTFSVGCLSENLLNMNEFSINSNAA
jgi:hypothetical protein